MIAELVSRREIFTLPPEGADVWSLAWAPDGSRLAVGLSDGLVAVWDLEAVRDRLVDFGFDSPSTARAREARPPAPVPVFERVVRVHRLAVEAERARGLATTARDAGDHAAERDQLLTALESDRRLAETVPDAPGHRKRVAWTHATVALPLARLGNTQAALAHLDSAAELYHRLALDDPGNPEYRRHRAYELSLRGLVLERAGRRAEAVDAARQEMAVRKELAAAPGTPRDRGHLAMAYYSLGFYLFKAGQKAEAERWYNAALAEGDQVVHAHPAAAKAPHFRSNRGATFHYLGVLRSQAGDHAGAVKRFREAAAIRARLADDFPRSGEYASKAGLTLDWLGAALWHLGQLEEAAQRFREAAQRQRAALGLRPTDPEIRNLCRRHLALLATILLRRGRHAEAANATRELPRLSPDDPAVLLRAARLLLGCAANAAGSSAGLVPAWGYVREAAALAQAAAAKALATALPSPGAEGPKASK
jgi:tetratricopeptide (TPR) repeat protein